MTTTSRSAVNAVRVTALVLLLSAVAIAADLAWMAPGRIPVQGTSPIAQAHVKPAQSSNERADRHYEKTAAAESSKNFAN